MPVDPVSLIVAALVAGVSAGTTAAVTDAYGGLREVLRRRLASTGSDVTVLDAAGAEDVVVPSDVVAWRARLAEVLAAAGAGADAEAVAAARAVMAAADPAGERQGRYVVDLRDAKGVQVGDHNQQSNTFHG